MLFSNLLVPFDFATSNELLFVKTGTNALDWFTGSGTNVVSDWLLKSPNELTLFPFVAVNGVDVTLNVVEAELSACETTTV